jgi:hypothetical protein
MSTDRIVTLTTREEASTVEAMLDQWQRWLRPLGIRNAAWALRNSRVGKDFSRLARRLVLAESRRLIADGEPVVDVLEATA